LISQLLGSIAGASFAVICGFAVYGGLAKSIGIRLEAEEEYRGADLSIHSISSTPEQDLVRS
jgi:Amt family ammonium transporter